MDNRHRKLFVIKQSERYRFMPAMQQNTFGKLMRPLATMEAYLRAKGEKGRENGGLLIRGGKGRGLLVRGDSYLGQLSRVPCVGRVHTSGE